MKYTNYIMNSKFIDADKIVIKEYGLIIEGLTVTLSISVAIMGLGFCVSALPITVGYDSFKYLRVNSRYQIRRINIYNKKRIARQKRQYVLKTRCMTYKPNYVRTA